MIRDNKGMFKHLYTVRTHHCSKQRNAKPSRHPLKRSRRENLVTCNDMRGRKFLPVALWNDSPHDMLFSGQQPYHSAQSPSSLAYSKSTSINPSLISW